MKNMNNQHHSQSNFWFGFSLGTVIGVAGVYFFGTKGGRKSLERALELTDNLEETVSKVVGGVGEDFIEDLAGSKSGKTGSDVETGTVTEIKESFFQFLIKSVATYLRKSQQAEQPFVVKDGRVVH